MTSFRFSPRKNTAHLVHWRAWGTEAFDEALRTEKLVALCITAFWCGVCQHLDETALSSEEVQLLLNAYFIPIRVEESRRPDVDLRYTQSGWPTIVFLTAHGEPVLSVNALETEQLISLLVHLVDTHEKHRAEFAQPPPPIETAEARAPENSSISRSTVDQITRILDDLADPQNGGFGGPHKYFYSDALAYYFHLGRFDHVNFTLNTLVSRAIYDASDGGFFRYSSKPDWNAPHREKLLMDQADLLGLYLQAGHQQTAERLIDYLEQTLRLPGTAFFAGCQDYIRAPEGDDWTPIIDPLVYTDANAHAASAFLLAWTVLGRADCRDRALELLDTLWSTLRSEDGALHHYFDGEHIQVPGLLLDSVALGHALLDAYATVTDARFVEQAEVLGRDILRKHLNPAGGFFDISQPGPAALRRPLTELTQNAAAARFFLRLSELRDDQRLRDAAHWALLGYGGAAEVYGAYAASFAHALDLYLAH